MNATGSGAEVRARLVRRSARARATTAAAVLGAVALGAGVLAPPASGAPGHLAGRWTSVDVDGSHQTMRIAGAGKPNYAMFLRDDFTTGACRGRPAKVVGHGAWDGSELTMRGTLVCLPGGNPLPGERLSLGFGYDTGADTLTDSAGVVWERVG